LLEESTSQLTEGGEDSSMNRTETVGMMRRYDTTNITGGKKEKTAMSTGRIMGVYRPL
jgi:hypothetical protein